MTLGCVSMRMRQKAAHARSRHTHAPDTRTLQNARESYPAREIQLYLELRGNGTDGRQAEGKRHV